MKTIKDWRNTPKNYTGIVEWPDGAKQWYLNGQYHRIDGPAIEREDGTKYWYLNGKNYSFIEWFEIVKDKLSKEQLTELLFNLDEL